jgi:1,4-dihydroxy-2-naphthoate octaprenyltransferase
MKYSKREIVLLAIRPKTLGAAIAPVMIGTAMAHRDGVSHALYAGLALLGALLIQIGTNLANDYFDFKKGADTAERLGPLRVTQAGLVSPERMKLAFVGVFGLAILSGIPLVLRGGWPIVIVGLISVFLGMAYTYGRFALAYLGLGDIFVVIFFGPVAVGGTYYVQALRLEGMVLLAGLAPGLIATGLLAINNLRDIEGDRKAGKMTLAARFGASFARIEYLLCFLLPMFLVIGLALWEKRLGILAPLAILPLAWPLLRRVFTTTDPRLLNDALATTGKLLLLYSLLFSLGWLYG